MSHVDPSDLTLTWIDQPKADGQQVTDLAGAIRAEWISPTGKFVVMLPRKRRWDVDDEETRWLVAKQVDEYYEQANPSSAT